VQEETGKQGETGEGEKCDEFKVGESREAHGAAVGDKGKTREMGERKRQSELESRRNS